VGEGGGGGGGGKTNVGRMSLSVPYSFTSAGLPFIQSRRRRYLFALRRPPKTT